MVVKVCLKKQKNFYVLFHTIPETNGSMDTYFPYDNSSESEALKNARDFGKVRAKGLRVSLEENLNQNA